MSGWNAAGQITGFNYLHKAANFTNTFAFNNRNQLKGITITRGMQNYASFTYNYPATQNYGRVQSMARQMWNTAGTQAIRTL